MRLPRCILLAPILIFALLTAGCGEIVSTLNDLGIVQSALANKFGEEVAVNVNQGPGGIMLTVWFINSKLNDQPPDARQIRAEETAGIVKASYTRMQNVRELWVGFIRKKTRLVVFHHSQVVTMHGFDKNGQPLRGRTEEPEPPQTDIQVSQAYNSTSDETDISVSGIQLEGEPGGLGVTMLPFFKVAGQQTGIRKPKPPKTVALNFASYAEKPRFKQVTPMTFVADGKVVHKAEGTFTGNDAQFCYVNVPYPKFRRMVSGKELIIKLGDKAYTLTPSQLGAMHALTDYVGE